MVKYLWLYMCIEMCVCICIYVQHCIHAMSAYPQYSYFSPYATPLYLFNMCCASFQVHHFIPFFHVVFLFHFCLLLLFPITIQILQCKETLMQIKYESTTNTITIQAPAHIQTKVIYYIDFGFLTFLLL